MTNQSKVGEQNLGNAGETVLRADRFGAQVVSGLNPRYREQVARGRVYIAHNTAAQAISVALATTYTGLCISNPLGSGRNLSIIGAGYCLSVAPAAIASLHLIGGYSATTNVAHTAALAAPGIQCCLLSSSAQSVAKADTQATITNPGYLFPLQGGFTAAALPSSPFQWVDIGGLIEVGPGGWVAIGALTAVTGFGAIAWMELEPV